MEDIIKDGDVVKEIKTGKIWQCVGKEFESSYGGIMRYYCVNPVYFKSFSREMITKANILEKVKYHIYAYFCYFFGVKPKNG